MLRLPLNNFNLRIINKNIINKSSYSIYCCKHDPYKQNVTSRENYNKSLLSKNNFLPSATNRRCFSYETSIVNFWKILSNSTPVAYVQNGLIELHDFTGLPWWTTIILSTILLRSTITVPVAIYQQKIIAKIELLTLEMPQLVKELKIETTYAMKKFNWTEKQARAIYNRSLKKQWNKLIVRDNCHPVKTMLLLWLQLPLWLFQSMALRNLVYMLPDPNTLSAKLTFTELTIGGLGWIPNLTEVDSSFIIPVALGIVNLAIIEIQTMTRVRPPTKFQNTITMVFRLISIGMVPIAASVPSALSLYWLTSSTFGLIQNLTLLSTKLKRVFNIPKTSNELEKPYQHLMNCAKNRLKIS